MRPNITTTPLGNGLFAAHIVGDDYTLDIPEAALTVLPYTPPVVAPVDPPAQPAPPPANNPVDPPTAPSAAAKLIGQTLTTDKAEIHVGDTFIVTGTLNYSDKSNVPVPEYHLVDFNAAVVDNGHQWVNTFKAIKAGKTTIVNNIKVGGVVSNASLDVTVLP